MQIIDNINYLFGDDLKQTISKGSKIQIAASCFSIYAYEALKEELEKIDSLEFIFTAPTFTANEVTDKIPKEQREFFIPKTIRERNLYGSDFEIQLKNKLTQKAIARECADWIKRKVSFKSNKSDSIMQPFMCVRKNDDDFVYAPINGFTAVDLGYQQGNATSNFIHKLPAAYTEHYFNLFGSIWSDKEKLQDVTESICNYIESVYKENSPEKIYFLMLYNIFTEFLEDINEDILPNDRIGYKNSVIWNKLYNFQKDAATGIINKLEKFNGCILADSVGLGKTFTALAVIKYYELRNKTVLVLCPKKLADNWLNYKGNRKTNILLSDRLNYDVLCHTDLQRVSGYSLGMQLNRVNWENYDLVVIDESHNFRNNDAFKDRETRYQKLMNMVIKKGVKTKVLMLSATPVNNRFNDLKNQLALAYEGESESLRSKLKIGKSIEEIFRQAQSVFNVWSKLPPEQRTARSILDSLNFDFFELLDSVTIARSRKHITTFYDTTDIGEFPRRRKPLSFRCPLTMRRDVYSFNDIYKKLDNLTLSYYTPIKYVLSSRLTYYGEMYDTIVEGGKGTLTQAKREESLKALMTINLLKRLESSVEAFRLTLNSLLAKYNEVLNRIEEYKKSGKKFTVEDFTNVLENMEAEEDDFGTDVNDKIGNKVQVNLSDMDLTLWKDDLSNDYFILKDLIESMEKVSPAEDSKLQYLITQIKDKVRNPINQGNKKVIIFSAFADTANYLYNNISGEMLNVLKLHTGKVTGSDNPATTLKKGYDFQSVLTLFSPHSKEKKLIMPDEPGEIDVLIGTDCISEGQNLQDCDYLVNYDIHWNPVRIIQRFGRIDRIGSLNKEIQLVNFWPDISLDEYINLKERVENRMIIADVTATGDDNVLNQQSADVSYRKEQLRRLQEEVIELEDLKTGVNITDLGLNDFRMDLLNYVKTNGDLKNIPNGMHAVIPADSENGLKPGIIFTLRNRNSGININQHNRLHPYYLVYIDNSGEVVIRHTEVKQILDLTRKYCKDKTSPIPEVYKTFNNETNDGKKMDKYSELLGAAIRSMIAVKEEKDIDSLFTSRKTSALINEIKGLNDFELITFLIIREV